MVVSLSRPAPRSPAITVIVTADTDHVSLDTSCHQSNFGLKKLENTRGGVQGDAEPHLAGVGFVDTAIKQEVACCIGAVDLEAQGRRPVTLGQAQVVEHRPDVQQLKVGLQSPTTAL